MVFSWTRVAGAGTWGQLWRCWSAIYCIHEISVCILRPLMINCEWITEYWMIVNVYDKLWMDNNEYNYENLVSSLLWSISWRLSHKIGHDGNPKINHSQILGVWNRVYHGSPAINVKWPLLMVGFRILSWHGLYHMRLYPLPWVDQDWFSIQKLSPGLLLISIPIIGSSPRKITSPEMEMSCLHCLYIWGFPKMVDPQVAMVVSILSHARPWLDDDFGVPVSI